MSSPKLIPRRHRLLLAGGDHPGRRSAILPPGLAGRWCIVRVRGQAGALRVSLADRERDQIVREIFLGGATVRRALVHVPAAASEAGFEVFGAGWAAAARADIRPLPRAVAAAWLAGRSLPLLPGILRGSPLGLPGRLRARIGRASLQDDAAPGYDMWRQLYGLGDPAPGAGPGRAGQGDALSVLVIDDQAAPALAVQSLHALAEQGVRATLIRDEPGWRAALAASAGRPVALLQAGECAAAGAVATLAAALGAHQLAYGDEDRLDPAGRPEAPHFKPLLAPALLASFTLSGGLMAFRPGLLADLPPPALAHADLLRFAASLRAFSGEAAPSLARVQRILTHRLPGTAIASPDAAATILAQHLAALSITADVTRTGYGLRLLRRPSREPAVGIVIPSSCRSPHGLACLRRLLATTAYPVDAIVVAVSDPSPNEAQRRRMAALARLKRVTVLHCPMPQFDYARINAAAAATLQTELLLLLNDDVAPIAPDWLAGMVAHLEDPSVGIVGARLLYGNGTVQHAGVVLGLAHLCEHNDRFRRADDPGPFGAVLLDRDVSAVTGACLLIRRSLWQRLGGFDPAFAIALNDVDLCLRARALGHRVIYAAGVALHHYESLSLGRHYAGARAGREGIEVRLLRQRWASVMQDDPFYNRNLSHEIGREWQPGFPPRRPAEITRR